MKFQGIGAQSDYSRAGKAAANDAIKAFAAARRNSPDFGKMVQKASDIKTKERMAMNKAGAEVAATGIAVNAQVEATKLKIDGEAAKKKGQRKAGVLAAGGKFLATAGTFAGEKRTRRNVGENDAFYDRAIDDGERRTNSFIEQLTSGNKDTNDTNSDSGTNVDTDEDPPAVSTNNSANDNNNSSTGGGNGGNSNTFQGVMSMARTAGAQHPELVAAQWALESGYGSKPSGKNNYFGQKSTGGGTNKNTWEVVNGQEVNTTANFMNFETPQDSVNYLVDRWHNDYEGYSGVNRGATADEAAGLLTTEGYATDPAYAEKLRRIMRENGF